MNFQKAFLVSAMSACSIINNCDLLNGQENCQTAPAFKWTPLMSEQSISLKCEDCSILEFGKSLNQARGAQNFPLSFDDYDNYLKNGSLALSKEVLDRKISLNLNRVPFWDAVGGIASKTNLGILTDIDGYPYLTDGLDTPSNHWEVVGPMLLRVNFEFPEKETSGIEGKDNIEKATHLELRFTYGDGEADRFDMKLNEVAVMTKSKQLHPVKLKRYSDGTRFGKIPFGQDEVAMIRGKVIANVATKLLWLRIHPNSICQDKDFGLRAKCSEVKSTKELILRRTNRTGKGVGKGFGINGTTYLPSKGHEKIYYTTIELEWKTDITEKQQSRLANQVSWDRLDTNEVNFIEKIMQDNLILDFVRNRPNQIKTTDGKVPDRSNFFAAAPNSFVETNIDKILITLFSEDRNKINICHKLLFARKGLLKENFTVSTGFGN
ncbi:hypothetical protein [Gimesia aquarii]|uniref:Uncharacterized protein n=1 Tax=Gimesia aquarii TaxID=2527964 RepID=A0A517W088_9PLAN|nr:hypothetical protein [Gimesia aquarii]QDT98665.1 hypothetical protein V144x_41720 [Gimesia aquarii]